MSNPTAEHRLLRFRSQAEAEAALAVAESAITEAAALHVRAFGTGHCVECVLEWPCATRRLLVPREDPR